MASDEEPDAPCLPGVSSQSFLTGHLFQLTEKATLMTEVEVSVKGIIIGFDDREQAAGVALRGGIVSEHGGSIYARSQLGKGATFVVELPVDGR